MNTKSKLVIGVLFSSVWMGCGDGTSTEKAAPPDFDVDAAAAAMGSGYATVGVLGATASVELNAERGFAGYTFGAVRGQRVTVDLGGALDAYVYVYGPRADGRWGRSIERDDDTVGTNARVSFTAPASGEYLVVATTYRSAAAQRPMESGTLTLGFDAGGRAAPELGSGDHTAGSVTLTTVLDNLATPTGLAFNPRNPAQVWVTNQRTDAFIVADVNAPEGRREFRDRSAHFLIMPTSLSFASDDTFATCQENANDYRGRAGQPANNFMGPVVYPADLEMLQRRGVANSHFDMLHHSPFCMGIANVRPREWWAFNGQSGAIDKYTFGEWHDPGADDHADGLTWRFAAGELRRVPNVPSQMVYDPTDEHLYIADTGNARVVRLDTRTETTRDATRVRTTINETPLYAAEDTHVAEVVGAAGELQRPSGVALRHGLVYVADHATGRISAFTKEGQRVNWLDTGVTGLTAIAFGPDGRLYTTDGAGNRLLRVDP